jgi:hypothetical protein
MHICVILCRTLIYNFENDIKEGEVYDLSKFYIAANVGGT